MPMAFSSMGEMLKPTWCRMGITAVVPPSAMAGKAVHNSSKGDVTSFQQRMFATFPEATPMVITYTIASKHPDIFLAVASEEVAHNTGTAPNPDRLSISNGNSPPEWLGRGRDEETGCCAACSADDHRHPD
ncbi:hypothetical protein [Rhizobium leguminosarum]|uniref:hypothetical protein n=1 Tax=Rhizobium leguminosarum TaxID=384 RepID=UPI0021BC01F1|nr:hypothetical protein [Rhizobium leguminosarum]